MCTNNKQSSTEAAIRWQLSKGLGSEEIFHTMFYQNFVEAPEDFPYELPHDGNWKVEVLNQILVDDPFKFHPPGSPYLGLTIDQQRMLSKIRRGGTKTPKRVLKKQKPATRETYDKILLACIESMIYAWNNDNIRLDRVMVYLKAPFNYRSTWDKNLPKPTTVAIGDWAVVLQFKVDKILQWLYDLGKCPFEPKALRKSIWAILQDQARMEFAYKYYADISKIEFFDGVIKATTPTDEKGKRSAKGRKGWYRKRRSTSSDPATPTAPTKETGG